MREGIEKYINDNYDSLQEYPEEKICELIDISYELTSRK